MRRECFQSTALTPAVTGFVHVAAYPQFAPRYRAFASGAVRADASGSASASSKTAKAGKAAKGKGKAPAAHTRLAKPRLDYARLLADEEATARNVRERALPLSGNHVSRLRSARENALDLEKRLNVARHQQGTLSAVFRDKSFDGDKKEAVAAAREAKAVVAGLEAELGAADADVLALAGSLPNFSHPSVPVGPEDAAVEIDTFGPPALPASSARDHVDIAQKYGWLDGEASAAATGASWPFLIGAFAHLEHALTAYAVSRAVRAGFTPVSPPDVVAADIAWRCGFQPRDAADGPRQTYYIETAPEEPPLCLTGTAEIPLAAMFANRTLASDAVPARVVGVGRAFRAEAGARGADTRGLYRVHQFQKVELFAVTPEDSSDSVMEEMRSLQKDIALGLGLCVRVLDMPTEELGASAARKYDMEAWMPGRGRWGEITSTSNCTDYQSRRLHIRYRDAEGGLRFAHTLNGTACAVPRLIVALVENGARLGPDGDVTGLDLPKALRPYWLGPEADDGAADAVIRFV